MSEKVLSPKWQARFEQIENYLDQKDKVSRKEKNQLYRSLPFTTRFNWLAFIFGFFYFLFLGIWRKGVVLLLISFVILFGAAFALEFMDTTTVTDERMLRAVGFGVGAIYAPIANFAYYLHIRKGSRSWNPFEGIL